VKDYMYINCKAHFDCCGSPLSLQVTVNNDQLLIKMQLKDWKVHTKWME